MSTLFHRHPVIFVFLDAHSRIIELPEADVDIRKWYPSDPVRADTTPLTHSIHYTSNLPDGMNSGYYTLGLWMPDKFESIRHRSDYAIRVDNGDIPFWVTSDGRDGGVNLLGSVRML